MPALTAYQSPRNRMNLSSDGPSDAQHLWTVTCTPGTNEFDIVTFRKVPQLGKRHPRLSDMTVVNHQVTQVSQTFWQVLVQYAMPAFDLENGSNPLLQPPVVNFETEKWEEEISEDINGTPFTTVLGDPLVDEPVFRRFTDRVAVIEKNVPSFNQWEWDEMVNTDTFMGAPPGHALLEEITAQFNHDQNVPYYRRVARVHFRKKGWRIRRLHRGTSWKIRLDDGRVVTVTGTRPVLLNENGFRVPYASNVAKPPFYNDASYLTWDIYPRGSFNRLRLFG